MPAPKKIGRHSKVKARTFSLVKLAMAAVLLGGASAVFAFTLASRDKSREENSPVWCAYGSQLYDSGLGNSLVNYCGAAKSASQCEGLLLGTPFKTMNGCLDYLSALTE
ncbi:MAG: hypothetical protein AAB390_04650 [Patescibacteria group bacterium]